MSLTTLYRLTLLLFCSGDYLLDVRSLLIFIFSACLASGIPKILSQKQISVKKDANGKIVFKQFEIRYKGGWIQRVDYLEETKIVITYNQKGRMVGMETRLLQPDSTYGLGEAKQLLALAFKTITEAKYDEDQFVLGEADDGRTIAVWRKRYMGENVVTYMESKILGCITSGCIDAVNKDLIPK